jgi:hypothetical protein
MEKDGGEREENRRGESSRKTSKRYSARCCSAQKALNDNRNMISNSKNHKFEAIQTELGGRRDSYCLLHETKASAGGAICECGG